MSFWCLYCYFLTYFLPSSSASIVNFEHVIAGWVMSPYFCQKQCCLKAVLFCLYSLFQNQYPPILSPLLFQGIPQPPRQDQQNGTQAWCWLSPGYFWLFFQNLFLQNIWKWFNRYAMTQFETKTSYWFLLVKEYSPVTRGGEIFRQYCQRNCQTLNLKFWSKKNIQWNKITTA